MKQKKAFTLVELLIVISIIGILAALLMPAISAAQRNAVRSTSKAFLTGMVTALERYKDEYGYFPQFLTQRERTNLDDGSYSENFVKAVTGKDPEGRMLSASDRREYNRKAREFMTFNSGNLIQNKAGGQWKVVDGFGNPNIYVCVDDDNDGFIKQGFPNAADGLSTRELRDIVPNPQAGLRAKAVVFTLEKDGKKPTANYTAENIFTWEN